MKIALMAYRYGPSHGSILQTYALTKVLEYYGHKVEIINRQPPFRINDLIICLKRVIKLFVKGRLTRYDFYVGQYPKIMMRGINSFIDCNLREKTISFSSSLKLKHIGNGNYQAFIVGSDQTWRPNYVYDIYNYYLDFVPKESTSKRIAYAPSFGTSEWEYTLEQENRCRKLIELFDGVSVREEQGVQMCFEHFGIRAQHVLDPTLLLPASHYFSFVTRKKSAELIYNFLDYDKQKKEIVLRVSDTLKMKAMPLLKMGDKEKNTKERIAPSIEDWLSGIYNSEYMIVDSFHATVFCIIFHKRFITVGNDARGLSRFTSLLNMLDLGNRLVHNLEEITDTLINEKIDWDKIDRLLESKRSESISFLIKSLSSK